MTYQAVTVKQIHQKQVVGLSGEKLGVIEDVVMGQFDGSISHVIKVYHRVGTGVSPE